MVGKLKIAASTHHAEGCQQQRAGIRDIQSEVCSAGQRMNFVSYSKCAARALGQCHSVINTVFIVHLLVFFSDVFFTPIPGF